MADRFVDVPCPGCACLCDDLVIEQRSGAVTAVGKGCDIARRVFAAEVTGGATATAASQGNGDRGAKIAEAAAILRNARLPLVYGLGGLTCEAQRLAVQFAELLGAVVATPGAGAGSDLFATVGHNACTLGEIRERANLIVIVGCDPLTTRPRLLERYASQDSRVVVVDSGDSATAAVADQSLAVSVHGLADGVEVLLAVVSGAPVDEPSVLERTGVALASWRNLARQLQTARYPAIIYRSAGSGTAERRVAEAIHQLTRKLNETTRAVSLAICDSVNDVGAENVITWTTGYPPPVDFSQGFPRPLGDFQTIERMLSAGQFDAALVFTADPIAAATSRELADAWRRVPLVAIDWRQTATMEAATTALRIAAAGIHSGGTMFRLDGVALPLRPPLVSQYPSDQETLGALLAACRTSAPAPLLK